jgi:flagellar motor protein MotB
MDKTLNLLIVAVLGVALSGCSGGPSLPTVFLDNGLTSEKEEKAVLPLSKSNNNIKQAMISPIKEDTAQFKELIDTIEKRAQENQEVHISSALKMALTQMSSDISALSNELNVDVKGDIVLVTIPGNLMFAEKSSSIRAQSFKVMTRVADYLKKHEVTLAVYGYSYMEDNTDTNKVMSYKRAERVRLFFVNQGINQQQVHAIGKGDSNPIATPEDFMGRQKNRRIELRIKLTR